MISKLISLNNSTVPIDELSYLDINEMLLYKNK